MYIVQDGEIGLFLDNKIQFQTIKDQVFLEESSYEPYQSLYTYQCLTQTQLFKINLQQLFLELNEEEKDILCESIITYVQTKQKFRNNYHSPKKEIIPIQNNFMEPPLAFNNKSQQKQNICNKIIYIDKLKIPKKSQDLIHFDNYIENKLSHNKTQNILLQNKIGRTASKKQDLSNFYNSGLNVSVKSRLLQITNYNMTSQYFEYLNQKQMNLEKTPTQQTQHLIKRNWSSKALTNKANKIQKCSSQKTIQTKNILTQTIKQISYKN